MLTTQHDILQSFLDKRKEDLSFRELAIKDHLIDFCSNDYLGFARSALLRHRVDEEMKRYQFHAQGSTGSRLITGNNEYINVLEKNISEFHNAENSLIFNSGYDANLGLFASVPQKDDLIIFDEMVHASIRDGIKMSRAASISFIHNDIEDLHNKLKMSYNNAYISIESVYSMDGDELIQFLVNFSRSFIYTTALPFHSLINIKCVYDILANQQIKRNKISILSNLFKQKIEVFEPNSFTGSNGSIQSVIIPGNDKAKQVAAQLEKAGYYAKAILYPTVPRGSERIRFCIHSFNTEEQINTLTFKLNELLT
jgi:7-keto-8-aminopelargonate synthetase-like enzyme